jgi:hypothetical protein
MTTERFIGAMWYRREKRKPFLPPRPGVSWPLAELLITDREITIRPRFSILRGLIPTWQFPAGLIGEVRHRSTSLGEMYRFYLRDGRRIEFDPLGSKALHPALRRLGITVEEMKPWKRRSS